MSEEKGDSEPELSGSATKSNLPGGYRRQTQAQTKRPQAPGSKLQQVDNVLPAVVAKLGLDRKMKEHALMQVWSTLLPDALARRSRPLFIDHQFNLVIAVADASCAQELNFMKGKLMQVLGLTARSLGIQLASLRMDMKNFYKLETVIPVEEPPLPQPTEGDLAAVTLNNYDMQLISQLAGKLGGGKEPEADSNVNVMVMRTFEKQLRLAEWRRRNGYPVCQICGNPVSRLFARGSHKVCFNCSLSE